MRAVLALALAVAAAPASAAQISAVETPDHRPALLIEGPIVEGDQYALEKVWSSHPSVQAVILNSPGGLILPALRMGETIRRGGLATVVMPGELCASACGDIWLAGIHRVLPDGAKVGFHGVYGNDGKTLAMTGAGNGLVGAYLAKLGYQDGVIVMATAEQPGGMTWISSNDLVNSAGLSFETLPPKQLREAMTFFGWDSFPSKAPAAPKPLPKPPRAPISDSE